MVLGVKIFKHFKVCFLWRNMDNYPLIISSYPFLAEVLNVTMFRFSEQTPSSTNE